MIKLICLHNTVGKFIHIYIYLQHMYSIYFFQTLKICAQSIYREMGDFFTLLFTSYYQPFVSAVLLPLSSSRGHGHVGSFLAPGPTPCEAGIQPIAESE